MSSNRVATGDRAGAVRVTDAVTRRVDRQVLASWLQGFALVHVLLPVTVITVAMAGFSLGLRLHPLTWLVAVAATAATVARVLGSWRQTGWLLLLAAVTHLVAGLLAWGLPDSSWDGLALHQEAVIRLASGWNPLWEDAERYGTNEVIWLNHYPKGSWIAAAAVMVATGHIEAGKLFNFTLILAAAAMVLSVLLRTTRVSVRLAAAVAALIALNPVSVCQGATFYVDTLIASTLSVMIAGLVGYLVVPAAPTLAVALVAAGLAVNIKMTGLAYAGGLLGLFVLILWWQGGRSRFRPIAATVVAGGFAMLVIGWAPYGFNLRDHHDPFYPASPWNSVLTTRDQMPSNLQPRDRVSRFVVAAFSQTDTVRPPATTRPKMPFWIGRSEWHGLYSADIEAGGFGPLYGLLLLLAMVVVGQLGLDPATRRQAAVVLLLTAAVAASMFVHQETWWARYVPQAWLLPFIAAIPSLAARRGTALRAVGVVMLLVATLNVGIVAANVGWRELRYIVHTREMLAAMATEQPVAVHPGPFKALRQRLHEAELRFRFVDATTGDDSRRHVIPVPGNLAYWSPEGIVQP